MHTYRRRLYVCVPCGTTAARWAWDDEPVPRCLGCQYDMEEPQPVAGESATVIGDECDVVIEHGLCYRDGTPRRFRSKSEMKRVAALKGLVNVVEHKTLPGTDKSPFTTSWHSGPPPGWDPRPMCLLTDAEQAARRAEEGTHE